MRWGPQDVIAAIIIVGCFVLKALGHDTALTWALIGVVAGYYGIDLTPWLKLGRNQKPKPGGGRDTSSP